MNPASGKPLYCSECSRAAGEQLLGSAPRADVWLMLEYGGSWGPKSPDDSDLPDAIKSRINQWIKATRYSKFCFIKQRDDAPRGATRLYVARSLETLSEMYRIDLASYDDLLRLDITPFTQGLPEAAEYLTEERLFAICTNGRRDVSCARYGTPVFQEFRKEVGLSAWQTTHLGGHRFAATLVCLPEGVVYGFVDPEDTLDLIVHTRKSTVRLDKLRGRSCYDDVEQAAEQFLREERTLTDIYEIRLVGKEEVEPDRWLLRFETLRDRQTWAVNVERYLSDFDVIKNTGESGAPVPQFRLIEMRNE